MSDDKRKKDRDERNPEEIERDIENTRENLGDDLDEISRRMSPENVKKNAVKTMDDAKEAAMDRVEGVANDVMDQTKAASERVVERVRENPMPAALLLGALGAGFFLMKARGESSEARRRGSSRMDARDRTGSATAGSDVGQRYSRRSRDHESHGGSSLTENSGLLVGLGALAAGAAVGMLMPTSSDDIRKGRRKVQEATRKVGSALPFTGEGSSGSSGGIHVRERIRVNKSAEELYSFWRDLENLPKVMSHLEEVTTKAGDRSHWKVKGPLNAPVEWDAKITRESANESIAWRSEPGSTVRNEGTVRFRSVGPNKTEIMVSLTYHPPGGAIGDRIAKLLGQDPSQQISDDLEKFKEEVEAGRLKLESTSTLGTKVGTRGTTAGSTSGSTSGTTSGTTTETPSKTTPGTTGDKSKS